MSITTLCLLLSHDLLETVKSFGCSNLSSQSIFVIMSQYGPHLKVRTWLTEITTVQGHKLKRREVPVQTSTQPAFKALGCWSVGWPAQWLAQVPDFLNEFYHQWWVRGKLASSDPAQRKTSSCPQTLNPTSKVSAKNWKQRHNREHTPINFIWTGF